MAARWRTLNTRTEASVSGVASLARRHRLPVKIALSIVGAIALAWVLANPDRHGTDAYAYWSFDPLHPYAGAFYNLDASGTFRYSPPLVLALAPLHALPWPAFLALWTAITLGALALVGRSWTLALLAIYPVLLEVSVGNVHVLLALVVVLGFRWPALWSFALLTKITPGIGLLWFLARGEWRALAIALGSTALIAGISFVIAPDLWPQWLAVLQSDVGTSAHLSIEVPLAIRLPVAAALVIWGARTDHRWTLALATLLALPTIFPAGFAVLVALVPLLRKPAAAGLPRLGRWTRRAEA